MINLSFIMFLLVLMVVVSLITALVIEAVKKVYGEESIKRAFKSLEIFSLIFTMIVSVYVYIIFIFCIKGSYPVEMYLALVPTCITELVLLYKLKINKEKEEVENDKN